MLFTKKYYFCMGCLLCVFFIAGCSEPIRTLQALGAEKDAQEIEVKRQEANFKLLKKNIEKKRLKAGASRDQVVSRYGQPVLESRSESGEETTLLYRNPIDFFDTIKVYLIFDARNHLKTIEIEEPDGKQNK